MIRKLAAACDRCGSEVIVQPPNLPPSGGSVTFKANPTSGWQVLGYVCGDCWESRPRTWSCTHCGGSGPIDGNFCSTCHRVRPDPLAYLPDWDAIWKEERERQREHDSLVAEWDREYPGLRSPRREVRV